MTISADQKVALRDIANSIATTHFGKVWPEEYDQFYRLWGFLNRLYDTLYTDKAEWQRIAQFALDNRVNNVWAKLEPMQATKELASQPCVGDGRNSYQPSDQVRVAFHTLRNIYKIDVKEVCQKSRCLERKQMKWVACDTYTWPALPKTIANPKDAVYTPLGATLAIIYQIRNNLFHGSKQEIAGDGYQRNLTLVTTSRDIIQILLEETQKAIPSIK